MAEAVVRLRVDASGANRALSGVQNRTNALQKSFGGLRTAIGGIGITLLARNAVKTSTSFEKLNVRLKLLTKASGTFAKSQKVAADAQKAFGLSATEALEGITDITARLAPLGVGVDDIKSTFFGFNTAAKLAGASTIEASNAFRQLAQALGSGRLAGDEFRSISEQIPTLLGPIAEELGVTVGALKGLAAEGKLTSDVVLRALRKIETDGGASLKELIKNDPTQVFKNLTNETENLSRAFGDLLKPAVLEGTRQLTRFVTATTEFVNSDAGKAALLIAAAATAVKTLAIVIPAAIVAIKTLAFQLNMVGVNSLIASSGLTGMQAAGLLAAKGIGATTLALGALKVAIATTGIGLLVLAVGGLTTAFMKARREAKAFQELITEGAEEDVTKAFNAQQKAVKDLEKELEKARGNAKRGAQRKLEEAEADLEALRKRLETLEVEKGITAEKEKQNEASKKAEEQIRKNEEATKKLKEKFMEIGKAVEDGIVQNLTDAAMGTQTLGQAAINVLNQLKRKLIEVAIQQAVSGIGNFLGNALGSLFTGGFGRGGGGLNSQALGRAASRQTGIPMNLPAGSFGISTIKRANGGPVSAGGSYMVGERGPELFTPRSSGMITANEKLGGSTVNNMITVNVDASGSSVEADEGQANAFGAALGAAIQAELIAQKRAGGLLSNA
mgnify:CR=1 FL=1